MKFVTRNLPLGVLMFALCFGALALAPVVHAKTEISAGEAGDPGDGDGITSTSGSSTLNDGTQASVPAPHTVGIRVLLVPVVYGGVLVFRTIVLTAEFSVGK